MNENKKKELMEKLTTREVIDTYADNKGKRLLILIIILLIIVGCICFFKISKTSKKKENKYDACKLDDCKTFKKEFIEEIRYGYTLLNKDITYYNCGGNKDFVTDTNNDCYKSKTKDVCPKYSETKKYCYAFTKDNVKDEKYLYLINPSYISDINNFSSLESLYIDVDDNNKDLDKLFTEVIKLSNNNENLKIFIFINDISEKSIKNISALDDKDYENINVCLFDKESCLQNEVYSSLQDAYNLINEIKSAKTNMNKTFSKASDLEKVTFMYSYITSNFKVDEDTAKDEALISTKNYKDVAKKKSLGYLISYKKGSYHAFALYYDVLLNYVGIDTNIVSTSNLDKKVYHEYNQVKVDKSWYNTDVTLDAINKENNKDSVEFFLKSDDDFNHSSYNIESKTNKATKTYDEEKILKIINKIN